MFALAFNIQPVKSGDEWIPYVPQAQYVQLYYWMQNGISYMNVSITFASSGFNVSDWGMPVFDGNSISVDSKIWMYTGYSFPWETVLSNTYNLGKLQTGEYTFIFEAWGNAVKNTTFTVLVIVPSTVDVNPRSLNLISRGKWIAVYIELLEGYDVSNINVSTILLNETIPGELEPIAIGDYDNDAIPDLMVKFDRQKVINYTMSNVDLERLHEGRFMTVTLTVTGKLNDGTPFQGSDTIKIILPMSRGLCKIFPI
jgi:hypothetical protein